MIKKSINVIEIKDNMNENPYRNKEMEYDLKDLDLYKIHEKDIISMEFFSTLDQIPLVQDGGVIMYIEEKNQNKTTDQDNMPQKYDQIKIKKEGRYPNGLLLNKEEKKFLLFNDELIHGIHIACSYLQKNTPTWFKISPQYQRNYKYCFKSEEQNQEQEIFYKIEITEIKKSYQIKTKLENSSDLQQQLNNMIEIFIQKKKEGNNFFKQKNYKKAIQIYQNVINCFNNQGKQLFKKSNDNDQLFISCLQIIAQVYGNLSQALIEEKEYIKAKNFAFEAIKIDQNSVKNIYRYANCLLKLGINNEESKKYFEKGLEILQNQQSPHKEMIKLFKQSIEQLKQQKKKEDVDYQKACQNIFQNLEKEKLIEKKQMILQRKTSKFQDEINNQKWQMKIERQLKHEQNLKEIETNVPGWENKENIEFQQHSNIHGMDQNELLQSFSKGMICNAIDFNMLAI